ncbi:MAG: glycosyltransferase family 9 protein [Acidobacteria bacterium]|nr:glycosyltransferase family 9 protein [Acidobacteriota bacterium]
MTPPSPFGADIAPDRLLVVRLGAVGDVVRTLPAVRLLRRSWPAARIAWAVEPGAAPLVTGHPDVDEVHVLERRALEGAAWRRPLAAAGTLRRFAGTLARFAPALALDFQSSFKSGLVARASRAPVRFGFDTPQDREGSHRFATHRVLLPEPRVSRVLRAAALARAAGAADGPLVADLALSPEDREAARAERARIAAGARLVAIAPFSSLRQAWKRYPAERWTAIASGLAGRGFAVAVVAGPGEQEAARALGEAAGGRVVPTAPLPLKPLAALLGGAELVISGDTGPMHLAWAAGAPVVAIYGPTDPVLNAPWGDGHGILAPPRPTDRRDADKFPGLGPDLVLEHALARLAAAPGARPMEKTSC